jgi:predicted nucleic acid-binding protein
VVVAGTRSDQGASFRWLLAALERRVTLLLSVPLCLEYESVLTRPVHLEAAGASRAEMIRFIDALVAIAVPVEIRFLWRPDLRDPDDARVLEVAVNGGAIGS